MRFAIILLLSQMLALPLFGQELVFAASDMARTLALEMREQGKRSVAVSTFRNLDGETTPVGAFFAEELTTQLVAVKDEDLVVVERSRTDAIFEEQKLGIDGLRESGKLDAFVKVLEVDALVVGTISTIPELGGKMRINARLIAVPSGEALTSASAFARSETTPDRHPPRKSPDEATGGSGGSRDPSTPSGPMSQRADGFLFELDRCEPQGGTLVCTFFVTNQAGDRTLQLISRGSRVVTSSGDGYLAKRKELGSRSTNGTAGIEIVSGIRTRGALHFPGVPPMSGRIPLLEIVCWAPNGRFSVQFRDVSL
jgi:TolB-like protein